MSNYIKVLPDLLEKVNAMELSKMMAITVCFAVLIAVWKLPEIIKALKQK